MFNNNPSKTTEKRHSDGADTSLIADGTAIAGDVSFTGALHLDGRIDGAVLAADGADAVFTLSTDGLVNGEVKVTNAVINGTVQGNIVASGRLELAAHARVEGDVHYQVLEMAAGARVNGRMAHLGEEEPRQLDAPDASIEESSQQPFDDQPAEA